MKMLCILRRLDFKSVKNIYNKYTKFFNYLLHQNNLNKFIILYHKHGLAKITSNRTFSFKSLSQSYFAFVSVFCIEKKNSDCEENHSDKREDQKHRETLEKDDNVYDDEKNYPKEKYGNEKVKDKSMEQNGSSKDEGKNTLEETQNNEDNPVEKLEKQNYDVLFMEAAKIGNFKDIKRMLKEGVNVNQRHSYGWTALHVATINGHFRIVAELLSSGADPNLGDNFSDANDVAWEKQMKNEEVMAVRKEEFFPAMKMEGNCANFTALHYAVLIQDNDIVSLLLRSGADPTAVSETGFSPLDFAKTDKMRNLLRSYMKNDDEDIMKLHSYVQRLVRKGYSINITTEESTEQEGGSNINAPVKLQIKKRHTDKLIKDVIIGIKLKNFVTV